MPEPGTPVPRPSRRLPAEPKAEPVPISAPQTGYASVANGGTVEPLSPHSVEAEQSVLGSILIDESALAKVAGFLRPDDFYRATHDTIYSAMLALDKAGSIIDLVTLGDRLRQRGKLDEVGGPAYLASLMAAVPTAVHVEHYARIVASRGLSRRLIAAAGRIAAVGYEELNDPETALARMRSLVDQVTSSWTLDALQVDSVALPDVSPPEDPDAWPQAVCSTSCRSTRSPAR